MAEDRTYAQFEARVPVQFNLNPTYHSVPAIRRMGVGGTIRKISPEDLVIESSLDLRDVCQIFSEEVEDDCHFELELILTSFKGKRFLIRGSVDWYQLSEPHGESVTSRLASV